jgi:hypothetical protein
MGVKSRNCFSIIYLFGAAMSCRETFKIERSGTPFADEVALAHRAHVVSAITFSAAALEAIINEPFVDATEGEGSIQAVPQHARMSLAALWDSHLRTTVRTPPRDAYMP